MDQNLANNNNNNNNAESELTFPLSYSVYKTMCDQLVPTKSEFKVLAQRQGTVAAHRALGRRLQDRVHTLNLSVYALNRMWHRNVSYTLNRLKYYQSFDDNDRSRSGSPLDERVSVRRNVRWSIMTP